MAINSVAHYLASREACASPLLPDGCTLIVIISFVCKRKVSNFISYYFFLYFINNRGKQHRMAKKLEKEELFPVDST